MPLMHVFEVLLLVAIAAGSFFIKWDRPASTPDNQK
jgi:hypothetical protein